ncbi:DNA-binding transcriptional MocR family regulator [Natronocella acetinitrilica]|uniref:DNA-binding transcriptional MocR family regulator n=1 Tax=Natronocella acetinitrilica TaxID=414046 RepID=A0AAE3G6V6_9GAMM|nr:PLP-dependent aminotransferase family protein [Natronocella acetinitrilica]MCP1676139.1 DNA-binding transcriptional MocR family regulator [Natronocella acetinitrilica]
MKMMPLSREIRQPLVDQVVMVVEQAVEQLELRDGDRVPSIRHAAQQLEVSRNVVVEAYDRLVARGRLQARPGSGFFIRARQPAIGQPEPLPHESQDIDAVSLLRSGMQTAGTMHRPGWGELPADWLDNDGLRRALLAAARDATGEPIQYGHPAGLPGLRMQLHLTLLQAGIKADPGQIITTQGASQALDIIARLFLQPGDTVLVDDPGYYTLFAHLRTLGVRIVGIPRGAQRLDTDLLEQRIEQHRPVAYFINAVLHNPTGTSLSPACAHRLLAIAERNDLLLVEDDVYGELHPGEPMRLAALGELGQVIYVSSFSKTLSSSLRVGYLAASPEVARRALDMKLLSSLATPCITERAVLFMLENGQFRRHLSGVRKRLARVRRRVVQRLEELGLRVGDDGIGGLFVWAELPGGVDAAELTRIAAEDGVMLAPGHVFRPGGEHGSYLRFNIAHTDHAAVYEVLGGAIRRLSTPS